jgi:hypothetical protein
LTDAKGHSRQVAFVQYTNRQGSESAIRHLSGSIPPGGNQPLVIKYATPPKIPTSSSSPPSSHDPENKHSPPQAKEIPHVGDIPPPLPVHHPLPPFQLPSSHSEMYPPLHLPLPSFPLPLPRPSSQIVFVTINGIPSSFDLMTFNFLTSYGRVVEGKVFYQTTSSYGHILSAPQMNSPSTAVASLGTIRYSILIESTQQIASILSLDGSVVVVSGIPVVVRDSPLSLTLSLALDSLSFSAITMRS